MNAMLGPGAIHSSPNSLKQIIKEKPFFLLILIELVVFWRPVFFGEVFYYRDLSMHFLPARQLVADSILNLELPLWDPYKQGGKPLLANPNYMALYPSAVLYTFLKPGSALTVEIVGHHLLGLLSMYVFARLLSLRPVAAFIAAIVYSFAGFSLSLMSLLNWHVAFACLPLLLCCWHLYLTCAGRKWWAFCVLIISIQLLAGAPELSLFSMILMLGFGLFYHPPDLRRKIVGSFVLTIVLAGAISAVQLLPAIENARVSVRGVGFGFDSATRWSLHPFRMAEFIFPEWIGHVNSASGASYWGHPVEGRNPFLLSVYFGLPVLVLTISTLALRPKMLEDRRNFHWFLLAMIVCGLMFSFGRHLPGLRTLFESFSLRSPFRFPVKFLALAVLPFSLLAAIGAETLFSRSNHTKLLRVFWSLAILFLALFLAMWSFGRDITNALFNGQESGQIHQGLTRSAGHTLLIWVLICICASIRRRSAALPLAALVITLDLIVAGQNVNFYAPRDFYSSTPGLVNIVKGEIKNGKLYRTATNYSLRKPPTDEFYWHHWAQQELLFSGVASHHGIPVIFHDDLDGSALVELNYMTLVMSGLPWEKKLPVLSASGVSLILTDQPVHHEQVHLRKRIPNSYGRELLLYSIENPLPPVRFMSHSVRADSARDALGLMTNMDFDPHASFIVATHNSRVLPCNDFHLRQIRIDKQERFYQLDTGCAGYLIFSDPYYPGWHASVNGENADLIKSNIIFSSIYVPAGQHEIHRKYFPRSVFTGGFVTLAGLLTLAVVATPRNRFLLSSDRTQ